MLTVFGPIQWAFSLLPKWEGAWAKWLTRYLTVHFYGAMLYFVRLQHFITTCISTIKYNILSITQQICNKNIVKCCVCFWECFSTCHNQNSGVQMLNLHFSLWLLDWHFNLSFYSLLWQIFVRRKPTYKDVAKIINFCRATSLYTNEI